MNTYSTRDEALRAEQTRLNIAAREQQRLHEEAERAAAETRRAQRAEARELAQRIFAWGAANGYPQLKFSAWQTLLGGETAWRKVLGWDSLGDARRLAAYLSLDARAPIAQPEPEPVPVGVPDEVGEEALAEPVTQRSGSLWGLLRGRRA